jgi:hypothetical protein
MGMRTGDAGFSGGCEVLRRRQCSKEDPSPIPFEDRVLALNPSTLQSTTTSTTAVV